MERIERDDTPAEEWLQSLNATCNRLSTQYLSLLRSASSVTALEESQHDPRCTYSASHCCLLSFHGEEKLNIKVLSLFLLRLWTLLCVCNVHRFTALTFLFLLFLYLAPLSPATPCALPNTTN
jgi:hypothetical protein